MKISPCMICYEMLPSDALKIGFIKILLEALAIKCSLVHYVQGTIISSTVYQHSYVQFLHKILSPAV